MGSLQCDFLMLGGRLAGSEALASRIQSRLLERDLGGNSESLVPCPGP